MAEANYCEDGVTRARCGADILAYVFAANPFGASTVTAHAPTGKEGQGGVRGAGKVRLPRSGRLLRHADFEHVYKQGRRHFSSSMTVFYLQRASGDGFQANAVSGLRVGFTVGRALGGAVQRNRMKRRLREAVRLTRSDSATHVDVVINPKKSILTADFSAIVSEVSRAFTVIEQKLGSKSLPVAEKSQSADIHKPKLEA